MQPIAPDVLAELQGLSPALSGAGLGVGVLLWVLGWRWHRFWIVLGVTAAAGLIGLHAGRALGPQLLLSGLLLAVCAGLLAMELARVFAFAAAGGAAWLAVRAIAPTGGEPAIALLVGGLLGVLLFRFWTMVLTSLVGTLLTAYASLCLAGVLARLDAPAWAAQHALPLNIGIGISTLLGVVAQAMQERWRANAGQRRKQRALALLSEEEREQLKKFHAPRKPAANAWWPWPGRSKKRKAA